MALFSNKKQKNAPRRRQQPTAVSSERASEPDLEERYAFRRNRTLTGSASSKVITLSEKSAQLKSPRVHAHELVARRRHLGAMLFVALIICSGLYFLISQFTAGVVISSSDTSITLDENYDKIVQSYLSSQPAERLRFLVNRDHLTEYVQSKVPEVASIIVDGDAGFGVSRFTVTMRRPIAGWSVRGNQQYVDATGTPFSRNYYASPSVEIVDKSGIQVEAGQAVASNRFLAFVGRVVGLAPAQGYTVTQVIIPSGTTRQIEVMLEGVKYPVKLSIDRPAGDQTEDMARAVKWMSDHKQSPQYIDVRIGGKAYYR